MVPWALLLLSLCALLLCHHEVSASSDALASIQQLQSHQAQQHEQVELKLRTELNKVEEEKQLLGAELESAYMITDLLRQQLRSSLADGEQVQKHMDSLEANVKRIESRAMSINQQVSDRIQEVTRLSHEKNVLTGSLDSCQALIDSIHESHSNVGQSLQQSLNRMIKDLTAHQEALTRFRQEMAALKKQTGAADSGHPVSAEAPNTLIAQLIADAQTNLKQVESLIEPIKRDTVQAQAKVEEDKRKTELPIVQSETIEFPSSVTSNDVETLQRFLNNFLATMAKSLELADHDATNRGTTSLKDVRAKMKQRNPFHSRPKQAQRPDRPKPKPTPTPPPAAHSPNTPSHLNDLPAHFVKDRPLHLQSLRLASQPDTNEIADFPSKFRLGQSVDQLSAQQDNETRARQMAIREEFAHAWKGYKDFAYGFDELHPISRSGSNSQYYMALTMIDGLDTLILMGFEDEYKQVRAYLAEHLIFTEQEDINVFETSIRVIGGLLAAYALTGDKMFLDKSEQCAQGLLISFDTPTGLPFGTVGLRTKKANNPMWSSGSSTMSEVGTIQMEWQYLARCTGNPIYEEKVDKIIEHLHGLNKPLYPLFINVDSGQFSSSIYTFGARVDSIYEYFLKQHLLSGNKKPKALQLYLNSMRALENELVREARPLKEGDDPLTYIAEKHNNVVHGKMDHLVCFVPGMLALGVERKVVPPEDADRHMTLAKKLMRTCNEMYTSTATGLAPEIVQFSLDISSHDVGMKVDPHAQHNLLRPETVESLLIMWRVTKDPIYREWGWTIFDNFRKYCRVEGAGYSGLRDVRENKRPQGTNENWNNWNDKMEVNNKHKTKAETRGVCHAFQL